MRRLLIDDKRTEDHVCVQVDMIARNYDAGILALEKCGFWDELYLDHDLGLSRSGYDIMCWLEEKVEEFKTDYRLLSIMPGRIICVSSNPPGRERIELVIKKLYGTL